MANFNTHVSYAAIASGLGSVLFLQVGLITQNEALALALVGTIGGILPDVDLRRSYPSQLLFALFGLIAAFSAVFVYENKLTVLELWVVGTVSFLIVRFPISMLFHRFTRHRGAMHSVLVALLCAFLTVILVHKLFNQAPLVAWFFGLFMFFGFLVHLLLDELYSVDFNNRRIKRSFGTAFKLVDTKSPIEALAVISLTLVVWYFTPSAWEFWDTLTSGETYHIVAGRIFPEYLSSLFSKGL